MADVFLCEKGQLTPQSKRDLRAAGVVVAEVADVTKAMFVRASEVISGDDMLWAVLDAINVEGSYGRDQRERLSKNLLSVVLNARKRHSAVTREDEQ